MGFEYINKLPTPAEIKEQFPLPSACVAIKAERDEEAKKIITGDSKKFLVIIGPCSADNETAVLDYVSRLVKIQEDTKEKLLIIPRVYTNKPRTTGEGYKGMLHQP
ncbi:MAG: 3-deoxy-7-phosphoheptulonate synthase, partial [Clostridiales bacterium]|nr:3-deoxy-7-phosphoheptulonate synthase [Clostridiales bacterium]